mmetsp:Transcript_25450/g.85130  ORF Transcript_25450/g.85130 Transcript_25450/m.85130 type:complete len:424 (+) Transcript_25450:251-1522(+)
MPAKVMRAPCQQLLARAPHRAGTGLKAAHCKPRARPGARERTERARRPIGRRRLTLRVLGDGRQRMVRGHKRHGTRASGCRTAYVQESQGTVTATRGSAKLGPLRVDAIGRGGILSVDDPAVVQSNGGGRPLRWDRLKELRQEVACSRTDTGDGSRSLPVTTVRFPVVRVCGLGGKRGSTDQEHEEHHTNAEAIGVQVVVALHNLRSRIHEGTSSGCLQNICGLGKPLGDREVAELQRALAADVRLVGALKAKIFQLHVSMQDPSVLQECNSRQGLKGQRARDGLPAVAIAGDEPLEQVRPQRPLDDKVQRIHIRESLLVRCDVYMPHLKQKGDLLSEGILVSPPARRAADVGELPAGEDEDQARHRRRQKRQTLACSVRGLSRDRGTRLAGMDQAAEGAGAELRAKVVELGRELLRRRQVHE